MINYDELDDLYDSPKREPVRGSTSPVNSHAVLLKRTEGAMNRFRKNGVVK